MSRPFRIYDNDSSDDESVTEMIGGGNERTAHTNYALPRGWLVDASSDEEEMPDDMRGKNKYNPAKLNYDSDLDSWGDVEGTNLHSIKTGLDFDEESIGDDDDFRIPNLQNTCTSYVRNDAELDALLPVGSAPEVDDSKESKHELRGFPSKKGGHGGGVKAGISRSQAESLRAVNEGLAVARERHGHTAGARGRGGMTRADFTARQEERAEDERAKATALPKIAGALTPAVRRLKLKERVLEKKAVAFATKKAGEREERRETIMAKGQAEQPERFAQALKGVKGKVVGLLREFARSSKADTLNAKFVAQRLDKPVKSEVVVSALAFIREQLKAKKVVASKLGAVARGVRVREALAKDNGSTVTGTATGTGDPRGRTVTASAVGGGAEPPSRRGSFAEPVTFGHVEYKVPEGKSYGQYWFEGKQLERGLLGNIPLIKRAIAEARANKMPTKLIKGLINMEAYASKVQKK